MPSAPRAAPETPAHGSIAGFASAPEAPAFAAGISSAEISTAAADASAEPIPNGGFDDSAEGWRGSNSALNLVPGGVTGRAVRVLKTNSRNAFAIIAGKPVSSPKAGARYRAGAFVRSVTPGMFVCLRAEEFGKAKASTPVTTERCRAVTTGWQRLKVETRSTAKGTRLVFSVRVIAALGGTSFDVDAFRLR